MSLLSRLFGGETLAPPGFEAHDLAYPRALVPIRHLLTEREAARMAQRMKAHARRQRFAWLRSAARVVRDILRRPGCAPAARPAPERACERCGGPIDCGTHCGPCREAEIAAAGRPCPYCNGAWACPVHDGPAYLDPTSALMLARSVAERDGRRDLRDALHHLLVLDCAGAVADVLPLLSKPSNEISRALKAQGDVN